MPNGSANEVLIGISNGRGNGRGILVLRRSVCVKTLFDGKSSGGFYRKLLRNAKRVWVDCEEGSVAGCKCCCRRRRILLNKCLGIEIKLHLKTAVVV